MNERKIKCSNYKSICWFKRTIMKDNNNEDTKTKETKCIIKRTLNFQYYENCLEVAQNENKTEHLQKKIKLMQVVLKKIKKN